MADLNGANYRIKAEHPGRPGQPLRISTKDNVTIGVSGDLCTNVAPELLASMIASGYVERVGEETPAHGWKPLAGIEPGPGFEVIQEPGKIPVIRREKGGH